MKLKTVKALDQAHLAQCLNYLTAAGLQPGLLINFYHPKVEVKRVILK